MTEQGQEEDSMDWDERLARLLLLRDRLEAIGVEADFWLNREIANDLGSTAESDSSEEIPDPIRDLPNPTELLSLDNLLEIRQELRKKLALHYVQNQDSWGELDRSNSSCETLVLAGDLLGEQGRDEKALEAYSLAIDLAPSPLAQLELGYLIGLRGGPQNPALSPVHKPLILRAHDELEFHGLETYEIIDDDLMPKPDFEHPEPNRLLRLALEAYGRVYCHYVELALREGGDLPAEDLWLQPLVLDGLGTLLYSLGEENALEQAASASWNWQNDVLGDGELFIENRLFLWRAYVEGEKLGRDIERAYHEALREIQAANQKTAVVADPDSFAVELADKVVARLASEGALKIDESDGSIAETVGRAWVELPPRVRDMLVVAEQARRYSASAFGRASAVLFYTTALEGLLRHYTNSGLALGELGGAIGKKMFRLHRGISPSDLADRLLEVWKKRNKFCHGDLTAWSIPEPDDVESIRRSVLGNKSLLTDIVDAFSKS